MLMPAKHIKLSESILALGSFVLTIIDKPKTLDKIWEEFLVIRNTNEYPAYQSFDNLVLAVDFLYSVKLVNINGNGEIVSDTP